MPFTRSSPDACCRRNVEYYRGYLYCCRTRILFMSAARAKGTNKIRGRIDIEGNECRANGPLIIRAEFRRLAMRPARTAYIGSIIFHHTHGAATVHLLAKSAAEIQLSSERSESVKRPSTMRREILRRRERSEMWKNLIDGVWRS